MAADAPAATLDASDWIFALHAHVISEMRRVEASAISYSDRRV